MKACVFNSDEKYQSMWLAHSGIISVAMHRVILDPSGAIPIHTGLYQSEPRQRVLEKEKADRIIKAELLESAATERTSPIVLASRKDRCFKFCVDHRRLNSVMERDIYFIPRMDESIVLLC